MTLEPNMNPSKAEARDKPFPWRCWKCGAKAVQPETFLYEMEAKHDGASYALSLSALVAPRCGNCGDVLIDDAADEQINQALRAQVGLLSPADIRHGLKQLGLNQSKFATEVGFAPETVSRWLNGAQIQSKVYDGMMRRFFQDRGVTFPCPDTEGQSASAVAVTVGCTDIAEEFAFADEWRHLFQNVPNIDGVFALSRTIASSGLLIQVGTD